MTKQEIEKILNSAHDYAKIGSTDGRTKEDREQYGIAMTVFECLIHAINKMNNWR